jgi:hypothetical protein
MNASADVVALRATDAVRIIPSWTDEGLESLTIDLAARDEETHCLVALPAVPNEIRPGDAPLRLWMTAQYDGEDGARLPFVVYVVAFRDGTAVHQQPVKFFAGPEAVRLVLEVASLPDDADRYQLVVYASRSLRGSLRLGRPRMMAGPTAHAIGRGEHVSRPVDLARSWRQEGRRVICSSVFGEHWAEMPLGWRLDEVHPAALAAADWILYAPVNRMAFGVREPAPDPDDAHRRFIGSHTLLSFSVGTDSTAAMTLLPDESLRYYCQRSFRRYVIGSGAEVALPDPGPWDARLARISNLTVVPNNFELVRIAGSGRLGFAHTFGYGAIGLLLADHLDVGALAFGSVMEQVFLKSGNLYTDIVKLKSSSYNGFRRLVEAAGVFLALPTASCSEVLTTRISAEGRYRGVAISCPRPSPSGEACGTCFKCFRKLRLEGRTDAPPPDDNIVHLLEKHPLKSATSVVYAAQRSGYRHPSLKPFRDLDLDFLERYHGYAVEHLLPAQLGAHVRQEFARLGIEPMSPEDERRLRSIGQVFVPEAFNRERAGLSDAASAS